MYVHLDPISTAGKMEQYQLWHSSSEALGLGLCSHPWMCQPVCLAAAQPRHKLCCGFHRVRGGSYREQPTGMSWCRPGGREELNGWHCGHSPHAQVGDRSQGSVRLHICAPVTTLQWPCGNLRFSTPIAWENPVPLLPLCLGFQSCFILC